MGLFSFFSKEEEFEKMDISAAHLKDVKKVKATINKNADTLLSLVSLASNRPTVKAELQEIYTTIKYLNPIVSNEVAALDEKIFDKMLDIKLVLARSSFTSEVSIVRQVKELEELIKQRENKS